MKKVLAVMLLALVSVLSLNTETVESAVDELVVLNWGEYMDPELIERFETEFGVTVVYQEVGSNEEMETKILSGTADYDIAIPSDYMIDKLRQQNLLNTIDFTKLTSLDNVSIRQAVLDLYSDGEYSDYMVPYFYGTIGIMYNTDTVTEADLTGFDVLFDPDTEYKVGMYDSSRDAVAAALLSLGYSVNSNVTSELDEAEALLKNANFTIWGEDNLKAQVIQGNLDMALVYSGDYFDELYVAEEEGTEINFAYYVPETTNIWVDAFVIPTTSTNTDLAHDFINFFLQEDVAEQNADWVGYAPVLEEVFQTLTDPDGDYGYDYDNYDPSPIGASRELYQFVSDERFSRLNEILNNAKTEEGSSNFLLIAGIVALVGIVGFVLFKKFSK